MLRRILCSVALAGSIQGPLFAEDALQQSIPAFDEIFQESEVENSVVKTVLNEKTLLQCSATSNCIAPPPVESLSCADVDLCAPVTGGCDSYDCNSGWCTSLCDETSFLDCLKNQKVGGWTYSMGGAFRYRYLDERNRLRPPLTGRSSSYHQTRFTPYLEVKHGDDFTGYVQAIDAHTFDNELPALAIDENRADLLQYYADLKLLGDQKESLRIRAGRQFLKYGSQHLVSPLGWANTFRNFEGLKLYYNSSDWAIDAFATRPVNGASGNIFRPSSYDTPDQSRWFSGVYTTWKKAPKGTVDLYWLWLDEDDDRADRIDGNRHTFGLRYAGSHGINDECGDKWMTFGWDYEGAFQVGQDIVGTGPAQDVTAGFFSANNGLTFNQVAWTPTISGIFYWGSGDDDPTDGEQHTVSTLFPLGHAYWGLIDNFSGQNLLDYSLQATVKPTKKLTLLSAVHWFQKHQAEDAIWNIAGAPFGGVTETDSRFLGTEVDLVATYAVNKNLTLQGGYFWFFYGGAVNDHPNTAVSDRDDASQFYFLADWKF